MAQTIIGLDIGSWAVKAVVLESTLRKTQLAGFHSHHVPADTTGGALEGEVNELAHTMWAGIHGVATLHLASKLAMGRDAEAMLTSMTDALIRAHQPRGKS